MPRGGPLSAFLGLPKPERAIDRASEHPGGDPGFIWGSCRDHSRVIWRSFMDDLEVIWESFGDHLGLIWASFGAPGHEPSH